jgi:hypothetical protein
VVLLEVLLALLVARQEVRLAVPEQPQVALELLVVLQLLLMMIIRECS